MKDNKKIMVFDLEADGLEGEVLEASYIKCNNEEILEEVCMYNDQAKYTKHDWIEQELFNLEVKIQTSKKKDKSIAKQNELISTFLNYREDLPQNVETYGVNLDLLYENLFQALEDADVIVGHNIYFDFNVLSKRDFARTQKIIEEKIIIDTMRVLGSLATKEPLESLTVISALKHFHLEGGDKEHYAINDVKKEFELLKKLNKDNQNGFSKIALDQSVKVISRETCEWFFKINQVLNYSGTNFKERWTIPYEQEVILQNLFERSNHVDISKVEKSFELEENSFERILHENSQRMDYVFADFKPKDAEYYQTLKEICIDKFDDPRLDFSNVSYEKELRSKNQKILEFEQQHKDYELSDFDKIWETKLIRQANLVKEHKLKLCSKKIETTKTNDEKEKLTKLKKIIENSLEKSITKEKWLKNQ